MIYFINSYFFKYWDYSGGQSYEIFHCIDSNFPPDYIHHANDAVPLCPVHSPLHCVDVGGMQRNSDRVRPISMDRAYLGHVDPVTWLLLSRHSSPLRLVRGNCMLSDLFRDLEEVSEDIFLLSLGGKSTCQFMQINVSLLVAWIFSVQTFQKHYNITVYRSMNLDRTIH